MKEMLEKRALLLVEAQELANAKNPTEEQERSFEEKNTELTELDRKIASEEARDKVRAMTARVIKDDAKKENKSVEEMTREYEMAFRGFLLSRMTAEQVDTLKRANSQNTTAATGGYTIPQGFSGMLEKATLYYMPFDSKLVTIWNTATGNDVKWPTVNDTSVKGYMIGQADDATTSAVAVTFADLTFSAYKFTSGMLQVSYEILEDSYFNMTQVLAELFGERMGRALSLSFTTGTGSSQPQGVTIGATNSAVSPAVSAITRANIIDLIHSVDPIYRKNGTLMFNDATLAAIKKLSFGSSDDRPLYQVSAIAGEADMIEGFKFVVNNDMADIGASKKSILFGDFKKFVLRFIGGDRMKVTNELFAATDEVGIAMFKRVDSKVINAGTNPIKYLVHPAS
jgi:HK97 family phage major capsid protein